MRAQFERGGNPKAAGAATTQRWPAPGNTAKLLASKTSEDEEGPARSRRLSFQTKSQKRMPRHGLESSESSLRKKEHGRMSIRLGHEIVGEVLLLIRPDGAVCGSWLKAVSVLVIRPLALMKSSWSQASMGPRRCPTSWLDVGRCDRPRVKAR